MTTRNFCTPQQLTSISGRYGYYIEDDCCSLSNLSDVNLNNLQNGDILCYNETTQLWENCPQSSGGVTKACPDDQGGLVQYFRLGQRFIGPPIIDKPAVLTTGMSLLNIPIANFTAGVGTNGTILGTGMNNYYVRGSSIMTYQDLNHPDLDDLFVNICPINPPIITPDLGNIGYNNASPYILIEPNECYRIRYGCSSNPKLKAGALDDGVLGMVFRLIAISVPAGERDPVVYTPHVTYPFQTKNYLPDEYQPCYFCVTETGSYSFSDNSIVITNTDPTAPYYYQLQCIYFQGMRFNTTTNTTLQGINVQGLFEIEPFFYLTKERIILS